MRRPFFHDRPITTGLRFLAIWPTRVAWQMGDFPRIEPALVGGLPPPPSAPRRIWLQHMFQVLEENWSAKGKMYWRCIGYAVPVDFVRRSPWQTIRRQLNRPR